MNTNELSPRSQRVRNRSSLLKNSVVLSTLGESQFEDKDLRLKSVYFEIIDRVLSEMHDRFDKNHDVLMAIAMVHNFDGDSLLPLTSLGIKIPSQTELAVVKTYFEKEKLKDEWQGSTALKILFPVRSAFTETYKHFEAIETFGSSTSVNGSSFSTLARIDTVRRMSMTDQRLRDLSFLGFEDVILRKFAEQNRPIQLF